MNRALPAGGVAAITTVTGCSAGSSGTAGAAPGHGGPGGMPSGRPGGPGGTPVQQHIHTIVRTPNGGDHGVDLLELHLATDHREHPQVAAGGGVEQGLGTRTKHT
ncbi:hypothetical protein JHN59_18175 [Streptomyces sp. MBT49]|uniref:hypothetical protein n=1 Tax=Streptomyces sp. MBT49 TaxID=1488380 RepID=UPI00190C89FB|nr:hypothetical protein [Streptomyces sp. MBT49]MBK3626737.1 hypothetical protein [Streptomyces sp. MBT49]